MKGHARGIRALQFDGAILITGSMDNTMRIWNWRTGQCIRTLAGHTDGVISLNYDKNVLASGSADSTIKVWNFRDASCFTLRGHRDWVNTVVLWDSLSTDASSPASTSNGSTSPLGKSSQATSPSSNIDAGKMLFSGSDDGTIRLWDLNKRECVRVFEGHVGQVQSMKILVVDKETVNETTDDQKTMHGIAPTPSDGSSTYQPNPVGVSGPPSHPLPATAQLPSQDASSSINDSWRLPPRPDGDEKEVILVTASLDNTVRIWDIETGKSKKTFFGHSASSYCSLTFFAAKTDPRTTCSQLRESGELMPIRCVSSRRVTIERSRVSSPCWKGSPSHSLLTLVLFVAPPSAVWSREDGKCTQTLVGHRRAVTCLQLTDTKIISGSDDHEVHIWDFGANAGKA